MKITIVNGSARKGNTLAAIEAFAEGAKSNHEIEIIQADKLKIAFCKGCDAPFYANKKDEIRNNTELVKEIKDLGSII